jgi:hypothetical protein
VIVHVDWQLHRASRLLLPASAFQLLPPFKATGYRPPLTAEW